MNYRAALEELFGLMGHTHNVDDIRAEMEAGTMQGFVEHDTWVVTSVYNTPRKKVLNVFLVVGTLSDLDVLWPRVLKYAEEIGADVVQAHGRRGWQKVCHKFGWKPLSDLTVFARDVSDGR